MSPQSLDRRDGYRFRQMELIEEEYHISVAPGVRADASAPMRRAELPPFNIPAITFGVIGRIIKSRVALAPIRNVFIVEKDFLADDESALAGLHVSLDRVEHEADVMPFVRSHFEVIPEVLACVLRHMDNFQVVV